MDVEFIHTIATKQVLQNLVRIWFRGIQHKNLEQVLNLSAEQVILLHCMNDIKMDDTNSRTSFVFSSRCKEMEET